MKGNIKEIKKMQRLTPAHTVRKYCLHCFGNSPEANSEIKKCQDKKCAFYPYRLGKSGLKRPNAAGFKHLKVEKAQIQRVLETKFELLCFIIAPAQGNARKRLKRGYMNEHERWFVCPVCGSTQIARCNWKVRCEGFPIKNHKSCLMVVKESKEKSVEK